MTKEVLLDCKFINTFNNEQLETIHSSCHKALHYNNVELDENNWKVISDNCIKSFKEPYCKIWRENIAKSVLKEFWQEVVEVDAPVLPYVAVGALVVFVFCSDFIELLAEVNIVLIKEVVLADGNVVEFWF